MSAAPQQFPFVSRDPALGNASLAPLLPLTLVENQPVEENRGQFTQATIRQGLTGSMVFLAASCTDACGARGVDSTMAQVVYTSSHVMVYVNYLQVVVPRALV